MPEVVLNYQPRKWAIEKLHGPESAPIFKRGGVIVIHRRGGKTTAELSKHVRHALDDVLEAARLKALQPAFTDKDIRELLVGRNYAHILPSLKQAKAVAWGPLKEATRGIVGVKPNETELSIKIPAPPRRVATVGPTKPGAPAMLGADPPNTIRLWGGDNADALRGIKLSGAGYDEFQDHSPYLHNAITSKSLADHLGYHDRLGTIKGKNQLYQAYKAAVKEPATWTALWQDIDVSLATEQGATLLALRQALADDRQEVAMGLMTQELFDQEWFLSPEAAIKGAIWGKEMAAVRVQNRILRGIFDPLLRVDTDWDLGIADYMTIWLSQTTKWGEVRIVGCYANQGEGLPHYFTVLKEHQAKYGYTWGTHYAPHDIEVRELTTGRSRRETAAALGFQFEVVPQASLAEGINAVRLLLPRCYFDEEPTEMGREALMQYRWGFNEALNEFTREPVHDWASHYADAFRGLAMRHQVPVEKKDDYADGYEDRWGSSTNETGWMG